MFSRGGILFHFGSRAWVISFPDAFADKDPLRNYNDLPPCYSAQIRGIVQRMLNVELGDRLTAVDAHAEMCGARAQLAEAGAE